MTVTPTSTTAPPSRDLTAMAAAFAGLAALSMLLAGPARVAAQMALEAGQVATLALPVVAAIALRVTRWQLLARRLALKGPAGPMLLAYLAGLALPGSPRRRREMARLRWMQRATGAPSRDVVPLVLIDRSVDRAAALALLISAALLGLSESYGLVPVSVAALLACLAMSRPGLAGRLGQARVRALSALPEAALRMRSVAVPLAHYETPSVLIVGAALAGLALMADVAALRLILGWLAVEHALWQAVAIGLGATILGRLTGAPGGIGGAEIAMAGLLMAGGVPAATAVAATLLYRLATLWAPTALGLCLLPLVDRGGAD